MWAVARSRDRNTDCQSMQRTEKKKQQKKEEKKQVKAKVVVGRVERAKGKSKVQEKWAGSCNQCPTIVDFLN